MAINTFSGGNPINSLFAAGKNKILNADFSVNQRNFSSTTTSATYGYDRFFLEYGGGTSTYSANVFTPGTAPVAGYEGTNYPRLVSASQSGTSDYSSIAQRIENVRTFAGQTVTFSVWAKASTGTPKIGIGATQGFGTGGSADVVVSATTATATISSSWARYSVTLNIPSVSGKTIGTGSYLQIYLFTSVGSAISAFGHPNVGIQNVTIDFWGLQAEAGTTATSFTTATGNPQGELAACQRYYWRFGGDAVYQRLAFGQYNATTNAVLYIQNPVPMRATPTTLDWSGITIYDGFSSIAPSSLSFDNPSKNVTTTGAAVTGATQGRFVNVIANNSLSAYLGVGAEL